MQREKLLEMRGIAKNFAGVYALKGIDFDLYKGEIHSLCGENGAGKSTLMKILAGNYPQTAGDIIINGEKAAIKDPLASEKLGISIVYQELLLSHTVTVAENMFMGREPVNKIGIIKRKKLNELAAKYLDIVKCAVDPNMLTGQLTISEMQMVQIAKALSVDAKIIVLDEPCSSISEEDSERLFVILDDLRSKGIGIIYIDHRLENIFKISDRITVLRDGEKVCTKNTADTDRDDLVEMMVGRTLENIFPKTSSPKEEIRLNVTGLENDAIHDVSFDVKKGEVFGLAGLVGAGRSEILRALFCVDKTGKNKTISLDGQPIDIRNPIEAMKAGFGYIPEDRKFEGLCLYRSVSFNTMMTYLKRMSKSPLVNDKLADKTAKEILAAMDTRYNSLHDNVDQLSGGNQQKVVISKWLLHKDLKVLLLDEPTRGIDVGAKHTMYKLISDLANQGLSIVLVTSELPELIGVCDRIAVVNQGRINGILSRGEFSQQAVMQLCL